MKVIQWALRVDAESPFYLRKNRQMISTKNQGATSLSQPEFRITENGDWCQEQ